MARIRTIKPQFWLNEELGTIPRDARLLYIGLWNLADDRGVFEWKPGQIKIQIFPYDTDISTKNIEKWLENLQKILNITKFKEDGKDYGYIIMFSKHQEIKRPSKWTFTKNLPQITPNTHPLVGEDSPTAPDNCGTAPESSPTAPLREKEKEKEKEKSIGSVKNIYGEFKNVLLTDNELTELKTRFPTGDAEKKIENLSQYIASHGKKYHSHYATILNWARDEQTVQPKKEVTSGKLTEW